MRRCEPPASRPGRPRGQAGFTLVEAVIVIALTGIVAAVVARFIVAPVQAYLDTAARAKLVDQADHALRLIGRDLRIALPNSARATATGLALELIPTTAGARYATAGAGALAFGSAAAGFALVGPPLDLASGQQVAFHNLGPGITGTDAYAPSTSATEQAASNRRATANAPGPAGTVALVSAAPLPVMADAPPHRVLAVEPPVSYRCDLGAGTLVRHQVYGFHAAQPDPPTGGTAAVVATGVIGCRFSVEETLPAAHAALVQLRLTLAATTSAGSESVTLHHAVHVPNQP